MDTIAQNRIKVGVKKYIIFFIAINKKSYQQC
jgi:hypothetical protein